MTELSIATAAPDKIVLAVVSHLNESQVDDALAFFADAFSFRDHGVGLEFNTKDRLAEFFRKTRELCPDMFLQSETMFVSADHALTEWTLQNNAHRSVCWQFEAKGSNFLARSLRGPDAKRQDHTVV